MAGIISLFEGGDAQHVERIMDGMVREFGVPRGFPGGEPHISYHLGDYRPEPPLTTRVAAVASATHPFEVQVSGYGVFGGPSPVLYLAVARRPELGALHGAIHAVMDELGFANNSYYEPATWLPHVTLAQQNLSSDAFPLVTAWLKDQHLQFRASITNLAFARETPSSLDVFASFRLGTGA
jgi:2'-5' RNA ligase